MALFWNGIVSVFVVVITKDWIKGSQPWLFTLFLVPFVLIGLGLIYHFFHSLARLFSPVYELEFGESVLEPGQRTSLSWRRRGGGGKPRHFSLWLVGREQATYRRGTDSVTETELFHESLLFETEVPQMMPAGRCKLELPADSVPTFMGDHNKLQWFVVLMADVPRRADVRDEFELQVRPEKGGRW